jgi:RNA polymerase sigma-70 factor (ECF subfamily)
MNAIAGSEVQARAKRLVAVQLHAPETIQSTAIEQPSLMGPWLYERATLLSLCLRWMHGNVAEAEDLLGDACLRVIEVNGRREVEITSPISFWATVINNLARDRIRRTRRWKFERGVNDAGVLGLLPAHTISAEQQVFLRECLAATERQLTHLNDKQRSALLLRSRGLDYPGIGKLLGTSVANARKLVETARRSLNEVALRPHRGRSRACES